MLRALLFCFFYALVAVQANNEFHVPPPAGTNASMDTDFVVLWRCDDCGSTNVALWAYQDKGDGGWAQESLLDNVPNPGEYSWTPHTIENLPMTNGFHFQVIFGDKSFDSGALFLVDQVSSSMSSSATISSDTSTASLFTSTPSSVAPSTTLSSITTTAPATSTPAQTNNDNNNDSDTLKVGLGVGLGVGIPFLLLIGGIFGYILFRRRSKKRKDAEYDPSGKSELPATDNNTPPVEMRSDADPHELHQESRVLELQGDLAPTWKPNSSLGPNSSAGPTSPVPISPGPISPVSTSMTAT